GIGTSFLRRKQRSSDISISLSIASVCGGTCASVRGSPLRASTRPRISGMSRPLAAPQKVARVSVDFVAHHEIAEVREPERKARLLPTIFSSAGAVLGTFAMYYREPRGPRAEELGWVGAATHLAAIAIARDRASSALRASEARARQLAWLYAVSSSVDDAILRIRDPQSLYDAACRIAVEHGLARLAWVGIYDAGTDRIVPAARYGEDRGYVDAITLGVRGATGQGPAARALATGVCAISNDIANDPGFYWKEEALSRGLRSCAVFPLTVRSEEHTAELQSRE